MIKVKLILILLLLTPVIFLLAILKENPKAQKNITPKKSYWLILKRKSEKEFLYFGVSGDVNNSRLIRTFQVKVGTPSSPTPLPKLLGRDYWRIIKKESSSDNPETAPYFLTLDIPTTDKWPYGPVPYPECNGECDWVLPGYFGLHGVNGNNSKLSKVDPGSAGCIRHSDSDITYLYNLLTPDIEEIRYYIEDI
ncbi:MAG: L,D-transpeptidase [Candidatus Levybacteria bacterium]|nr:L,D-transpeptidase [Candidatus Levybacteria bacterium]